MIENLLIELGLSQKETKAYLSLLQYGSRPTSFIARKSGLNRGTAYVALHALLKVGLVSKTSRNGVQYFCALDPKQLVDYAESRRESLENTKNKLLANLSSFYQLLNPTSSTPTFQLYEGRDGARAALEDTLTVEDRDLRAFLSISDIQDFVGPEFFFAYTKRRYQAEINLRALRTLEKDKKAFETYQNSKSYITNKREKRVVRYISEDLAFPISMYIYDQKLTLISSKEENYALIIRSNELYTMQSKLFEIIWQQGED